MLNRKRRMGAAHERPQGLDRAGMGSALKRAGWDEQEEVTEAAVPGGKRTPGSGSSRRSARKGDVVAELWRVEDKTTACTDRALRVARDDLEKIRAEARREGQNPALVFGFDRAGGLPREDWMAYPLPVAKLLMSVVDAIIKGDVDEATELAEMLRRAK